MDNDLIAIGGLGGSGTRVVADLLAQGGLFLGSELNTSLDNLWFTLLFKRTSILDASDYEIALCLNLFLRRMHGNIEFTEKELRFLQGLALSDRGEHDPEWLRERVASFLSADGDHRTVDRLGWKEPSTHIVADRLLAALPSLRFVHVIRNGLDMSFSRNQQQLAFWGPRLLGQQIVQTPWQSLQYWCAAHRRLFARLKPFEDRVLLLNYDRLCAEPQAQIEALLQFAGISSDPALKADLLTRIKPPSSMGRFRDHRLSQFAPEDVAYVKSLGFPTG